MVLKSLVLGTVLVSTPVCVFAPQDPPAPPPQQPKVVEAARESDALQRLQHELAAARKDLKDAQRQVDELLDLAEKGLVVNESNHDQSCQPSRHRALLSHFQWLKTNHHDDRAARTLATLVERVGNRPQRLCEMARELMSDKETAGQFDAVALALVQRAEQERPELERIEPRWLRTMALAHFLNHEVDRAVALQQAAIERSPNEDEYRVQLRTYQAAQQAVALAARRPAVEETTQRPRESVQESAPEVVADSAVATASK